MTVAASCPPHFVCLFVLYVIDSFVTCLCAMREVTRIVEYIADGPIDIQAELAALQAKRDAIRNRMCLVPWKFYPRTLFFAILGFYHANKAYMTAESKFKIQVPTASYLRPKWPLKRCRCSCAHPHVQNTLNYHDSHQTSFSFTLMTPHELLCFRENVFHTNVQQLDAFSGQQPAFLSPYAPFVTPPQFNGTSPSHASQLGPQDLYGEYGRQDAIMYILSM